MSKQEIRYVCQQCGYETLKWLGRCPQCETWNSLIEETFVLERGYRDILLEGKPVAITEVGEEAERRVSTNLSEFDRVLGGGIVPGSLILIGGEPGIGKSTLLLQIAKHLAENSGSVLYVSGEESPRQLKIRARRLGAETANLFVLSANDFEAIERHIQTLEPDCIIIDSVQSIYHPQIPSAPATVSQVRECTLHLLRIAKSSQKPIFIVGHVTKEGAIAGPKVLEHIVDTVLYFEGDRHLTYRILRAVKNRFGATSELGIFEMQPKGLEEVKNPSEVFLSERAIDAPGSVVVATMEGTRPILVELQALVAPSYFGLPRRQTTGIDYNRACLILAVLEKRMGLNLANQDVYLNVAGGIKVEEPAADLGVAIAVASNLKNISTDPKTVVMGEVGLTGEVRHISAIEQRLNEAEKLGFTKSIIPKSSLKRVPKGSAINIIAVETVTEALEAILK